MISFDKIFEFMVYYLAILLVISSLGRIFSRKHKQISALEAEFSENQSAKIRRKSAFKGLYKHCPCRKAVENGTMSSICVYSSVAGFMMSLTDIALMGDYGALNFILLALSLVCAYFGWVLKK